MNKDDKEFLQTSVFRPVGPQGQFQWLSTIDINSMYIHILYIKYIKID